MADLPGMREMYALRYVKGFCITVTNDVLRKLSLVNRAPMKGQWFLDNYRAIGQRMS